MVLKGASVIHLVQVTMFELYCLPSWRIFRDRATTDTLLL